MTLSKPAYRPPYKNLLLIAGTMFVALGVGNWIVGAVRARPYAEYLAAHPGPIDQPSDLKAQLLQPPDDAREERNVSRAKLEFYELVRGGGRLMVVLGALCLFTGALTLAPSARMVAPGERKILRQRIGGLSP